MSKRSSAWNNSEKESKIETFTRRWRCKVHATDGLSALSWLPNFIFLIKNPSSRKVLISCIPCIGIRLIYFEPSSKKSLLGCTPLQDIIRIVIWIVVDHLLVFQMDRKSINGGLCKMHGELKHMPAAFY